MRSAVLEQRKKSGKALRSSKLVLLLGVFGMALGRVWDRKGFGQGVLSHRRCTSLSAGKPALHARSALR